MDLPSKVENLINQKYDEVHQLVVPPDFINRTSPTASAPARPGNKDIYQKARMEKANK